MTDTRYQNGVLVTQMYSENSRISSTKSTKSKSSARSNRSIKIIDNHDGIKSDKLNTECEGRISRKSVDTTKTISHSAKTRRSTKSANSKSLLSRKSTENGDFSGGCRTNPFFVKRKVSTSEDSGDESLEYSVDNDLDHGDGQDSDYDTDLEMNGDKYLHPERYEHDTTGLSKYIRACKEADLQPIRYFMEHMQDDKLLLKHHGVGPQAMKALSVPLEINTTIEVMDLEGNWILQEGTIYLCKVLKENVFVTHLNLAENNIGTDGAEEICELLTRNRTIENLNLSGNRINDHAGESFHKLLSQTNPSLKRLDLSHNQLEDSAALHFKDAITENVSLEYLDLSWNHFQCKGCILLAQGLKENVGLKEFFVAMNGFGLEGGKALGEAIQVNRSLRSLNVSYCRLPEDSSPFIAHGLMHNDILENVDLSYNCLKSEGVFVTLKAIESNESSPLQNLYLGNTMVDEKFKELQDTLEVTRGLMVHHGGVFKDRTRVEEEVDPMAAFLRDPMTKLKQWVAQAGYRLIDLLRRFDKDNSMTISHEEFREGIKSTQIPITEEQIQVLLNRLDKDGDGEIDFRELNEGDKDHRKAKRDIDKLIMEKEQENPE